MLCVYNFGGYSQPNYTVGVPEPGTWKRILNTDEDVYEGAGNFLEFEAHTEDRPWDGCDQSISVHIPAMSAQFYAWQEF